MSILFLAIDGDDVGRQLETYIVTNQVEHLTSFFQQFQASMKWLEIMLIDTYDANILFNGGDNLLATIAQNKFSLSSINMIRSQFSENAHRTLSIGIGTSPRNAFIALKLAKAGGKDRVEHIGNELL